MQYLWDIPVVQGSRPPVPYRGRRLETSYVVSAPTDIDGLVVSVVVDALPITVREYADGEGTVLYRESVHRWGPERTAISVWEEVLWYPDEPMGSRRIRIAKHVVAGVVADYLPASVLATDGIWDGLTWSMFRDVIEARLLDNRRFYQLTPGELAVEMERLRHLALTFLMDAVKLRRGLSQSAECI